MSLHYIDSADHNESDPFARHEISDLVSGLLEPVEPRDGVRKCFRLAELLMLSNHLDQANDLLCALYKYSGTILPREKYPYASKALVYFWYTHPNYTQPPNSYHSSHKPQPPEVERSNFQASQWREYRETTRTGWMLEHCNLPEPDDPHIWKETDDGPTIAMCARLLAKNKSPGQYPPVNQLREALAAAQKLYAQPQPPITEWKFKWERERTVQRHSYLLYRRLVTELAIRVGELDTAAEVLSQGLKLDGFNSSDGGQLNRYLYLPGIYDVLPILAKKGKEGNPFYIDKSDAGLMVEEIEKALRLRAEHGRQWSLAPEKVGWEELLNRLAEGAWKVHSKSYERNGISSAADILHPPASEEEIKEVEDRVGELPRDLKEMLRIADGFQGGWHFLHGGMAGTDDIRIGEGYELEAASVGHGLQLDTQGESGQVIVMGPANECDMFQHFFVSPSQWRMFVVAGQVEEDGAYRFWTSAPWQAGTDQIYRTVRDWVASLVEELERMVKRGERAASEADEDDDE